jgi:aminoglycoside 6'-N-acetyltransferase I
VSLSCRLLGPDDAAVLDKVAEEVFDHPIRPDLLQAYLSEPGHLMFVALDGDLVVAQCAAMVQRHPDKPTELFISELGVSPAWHRRGIATELLRRAFAEGRARGCEVAWVGTEPDNDPANALYDGLGGRPVETFHLYSYDLGVAT